MEFRLSGEQRSRSGSPLSGLSISSSRALQALVPRTHFLEVDGKTIVRDNVHYIPRGGRLVHQWFVRPDLEKIFKFRQDTLATIFQEIRAGSVTSAG